MDWQRLVGILAVGGLVVTLLGVLGTLAGSNALVLDTPWQTATLATLLVVAGSLVVVTLAGGPSERWRSTPYW
ncbi:hypothetical protein ACKVMT_02205 [Halobacteriales archaeon Cl-PHB]